MLLDLTQAHAYLSMSSWRIVVTTKIPSKILLAGNVGEMLGISVSHSELNSGDQDGQWTKNGKWMPDIPVQAVL